MIQQASIGLNSRSEANPYDKHGYLPLITANMFSVINGKNAILFETNNIVPCLPRGERFNYETSFGFVSLALNDFIEECTNPHKKTKHRQICVDLANGNVPLLHDAIRKAKEIYGDELTIMSGNVSSVEAFVELAKNCVDFIRVGIGGSANCNTTKNTGVGQEDLGILIKECYIEKMNLGLNVKIVADGISSYLKHCQSKYGFCENGYATINKLLYNGADLVMVGGLFASAFESAGEKGILWDEENQNIVYDLEDVNASNQVNDNYKSYKDYFDSISYNSPRPLVTKYFGMSTQYAQEQYRKNNSLKPSEGSISWNKVKWYLSDWVSGNYNQDEAPFLMGYVHSLRSAMAYTGAKTLSEFKFI